MKYLCCSHSSWLGGAELAFVELLKCLSKHGSLTISVPTLNGDLIPMIQNEGINTIVVHQWPLWMMQDMFTLKRKLKCILRIIKGVRECIKFLRKEQPDMVIVNTISSPVPLIASKLLNIPSIVYIHENGGFGVYNFLFSEKCIFTLLGKLASKLICNSKYTYSVYSKYISLEKLSIIYPSPFKSWCFKIKETLSSNNTFLKSSEICSEKLASILPTYGSAYMLPPQ